ncbi:MAG: 1,4-dihydroxy-6-naphthoate synthase [Bacteroidales bacterium]|nr:1,4-dihydroxy-6-naphthoate synthase [Bacteroidales bacterium]
MNKPISLAFSPCPNDTFIFDALVNGKIDTEGLEFDTHIADVEALNKAAFSNTYDVSKLSYSAFFNIVENYVAMTSGSAFCDDFGPILLAKKQFHKEEFSKLTVAVPGLYTTAAMLYRYFYNASALKPYLFLDIENAVINNQVDMGVVIHENVFSFQKKGLVEIANLGKIWNKTHNLPVPLGCIATKRTLKRELKLKINKLIKKSISYAFENPESSALYVRKHAPETPDDIIKKHIATYVNTYSIEINEAAYKSVLLLYNEACRINLIKRTKKAIFVTKFEK